MSYGYAIALLLAVLYLCRSAMPAGNSMGLILGARVESIFLLLFRDYVDVRVRGHYTLAVVMLRPVL